MVQVGLTHFWSGELGDLLTDELAAERKPTTLELLARAIAENTDPVLSFAHIQSDLGICRGTFFRQVRHSLRLRISKRRLGVRKSDYEAWKLARIKPGIVD